MSTIIATSNNTGVECASNTVIASIQNGITPTGNLEITSAAQVDVSQYATAQVVDADLVAENIKKDVDVLGVVGTYEGDNIDRYIQSLTGTFACVTLPDELVLNLTSYMGYSCGYTFYRSNPRGNGTYDTRTKVTINLPSPKLANFGLNGLFYQAYGIKEAKITGDLSGVTTYDGFFEYCSLHSIDMELDFTSVTSSNGGYIGTNNGGNSILTDIRFKPKTLGVDCIIKEFTALNSTSLISIANGISDSIQGKTLTLHNTPKALLSTIMGTVADGTFTEDANGTTSLQDFIVNTKNWTIA